MSDSLAALIGPDPAAGFAAWLLRANAALAVVFILVLALREPVRRLLGPAAACRLWPAGAVVAVLTPLTLLFGEGPDPLALSLGARPGLVPALAAIWLLGMAPIATAAGLAHARFLRKARAGLAGPAVMGLVAPRIVLPQGGGGYSAAELELVRLHEREHVARKDTRALAGAAALQVICWFNPVVHLAAGRLRLDQELACDAAVILKHPSARGLYARTLLKSHMLANPSPLACFWGAGRHPLELRIGALKRARSAARTSAVHAVGDAILP